MKTGCSEGKKVEWPEGKKKLKQERETDRQTDRERETERQRQT